MTDYLTARDVARILAVPLRTAYDLMTRMEPLRMGRIVRVHRHNFERWVRQCSSTSEAQSGGRASTANGSRRGAATARPPSSPPEHLSDAERIHVTQPRRPRRSGTPSAA